MPTPPRWLPWKPASFPQKTSRLHSPPPRRWGLTHIHPRKGHRLGDGDRPRRRDHERLACSETWGGGVQGSEEAKSRGDTPTAPSEVQGTGWAPAAVTCPGWDKQWLLGVPSAPKFGHLPCPKRKAPSSAPANLAKARAGQLPQTPEQHPGVPWGRGAAPVVDPSSGIITPLPPASAGGCGSRTRRQRRTKNEGFVLVNNGWGNI